MYQTGIVPSCHVSLTNVQFSLCIVWSIVAVLQAPMAKTMVEITSLGVYPKAHTWSTNEFTTRAGKFLSKHIWSYE